MTDWHAFLTTRGAVIADGLVRTFGEAPADYDHLLETDTLCDLGNLGVLAVTGPNSAPFLQGQTTADFVSQPTPASIAGACCTPKGRVFAHFTALPTAAGYLLVMPRALIGSSRDTLARYAALSRVELADASADYRLLGLAGSGLGAADHAIDGARILPHGLGRQVLVVPVAAAQACWASLEARARPVGVPLWHLADIRGGIASLEPETSDAFIPQMLNFHLQGMLNFAKGCYTGQEVIARAQYRGALKRHLYRLGTSAAEPPAPGTPVRDPESDRALGTVLRAVPCGAGRCEALAVLSDGAEQCPALDFGAGLQPVEFLPLPGVTEPR